MYIEIHPYYYTPSYTLDPVPIKDLYQKGRPVIIRLDTIRKLSHNPSPDGTCEFTRLNMSEDHADDILILPEEGKRIRTRLLALNTPRGLPKEVEALTAAVRSLWELLRARMR